MKVTRITNRGRIAPSSPKPVIDSGRNSWSTASAVSSIYTRSPEPQITEEEVAQKLQDPVVKSTLPKKIAIGLGVTFGIACIIAIICGTVLSLTGSKPTPTTNTTIATTTESSVTPGSKLFNLW